MMLSTFTINIILAIIQLICKVDSYVTPDHALNWTRADPGTTQTDPEVNQSVATRSHSLIGSPSTAYLSEDDQTGSLISTEASNSDPTTPGIDNKSSSDSQDTSKEILATSANPTQPTEDTSSTKPSSEAKIGLTETGGELVTTPIPSTITSLATESSVAQSTAQPITEPEPQTITVPPAQPITELATPPTTQQTTQDIIVSTGQPTITEKTTQPITVPTAQPVTEPPTQPTTQSTTEKFTESTKTPIKQAGSADNSVSCPLIHKIMVSLSVIVALIYT